MKLINSSVEIIPQEAGLQGIYKQIEKCARTCYKSEDKITEDSAESFVNRMINSGHTAMLEHSAVYLKVPLYDFNKIVDCHDFLFLNNPYSYFFNKIGYSDCICISTNLRVLFETHYMHLLNFVVDPSEEDFRNKIFHRRITVKFTCDRGVSHELVRHRRMSFSQESSRYCNYSRNKFGNELTFIIPSWIDAIADGDTYSYDTHIDIWQGSEDANTSNFLQSIAWAEKNYLTLLSNGWAPQQARQVLPNALKTEICMTGFVEDWKHFFNLRFFGYTGKPHPDMQKLATELFFKMIHFIDYDGYELDEMIRKGFSNAAEAFYDKQNKTLA